MPEITGTDGDDFLQGTDGVDTILGLGGDDFFDDVESGDTLNGGAGFDSIRSLTARDQDPAPAPGQDGSFVIDSTGIFSTSPDRSYAVTIIDVEEVGFSTGDVFSGISQDDLVDARGFEAPPGELIPGTTVIRAPELSVDLGGGSNTYIGSDDPDVNDRVFVRPSTAETSTSLIDGGADGNFEIAQIFFAAPSGGTSAAVNITIAETSANETTFTLLNSNSTVIVTNMDAIQATGNFQFRGPVTIDGSQATIDLFLGGGEGLSTLIGGSGDDVLTSELDVQEVMVGGDGDDAFQNLAGLDVATGDAGSDTFVVRPRDFSGNLVPGTDVAITDFSTEDRLLFTSAFFADGEFTEEVPDFLGFALFTGAGNQLRQTFRGVNTVLEYDLDGDRMSDAAVTLTGDLTLLRVEPQRFVPDFGDLDNFLVVDRMAEAPLRIVTVAEASSLPAGLTPEIYEFVGNNNRVTGLIEQLDGDVFQGFGIGDVLAVANASFTRADVTVTFGSLILDIDADQDGISDGTVTLEGDFTGFDIDVTQEGDQTLISLVEVVDPFNVIEATSAVETLQGTESADSFIFELGDSNLSGIDSVENFEAGDQLDLTAFGFESIHTGDGFGAPQDSLALLGSDGAVILISSRGFDEFMLRVDGTVDDIVAGILLEPAAEVPLDLA